MIVIFFPSYSQYISGRYIHILYVIYVNVRNILAGGYMRIYTYMFRAEFYKSRTYVVNVLYCMRKRVRSNRAGRSSYTEGTRGNIPFRVPFCLVWFPSHVRHWVYNSFLVTPMGITPWAVLRKGPFHERSVRFGALERVERNIASEIHTANIGGSWRINFFISVPKFSSRKANSWRFSSLFFALHYMQQVYAIVKELRIEKRRKKGIVLSKK